MYMPMPKNAEWPSEMIPAKPNTRLSDIAAIAYSNASVKSPIVLVVVMVGM